MVKARGLCPPEAWMDKTRAGMSELNSRNQNTVSISLKWEVGPQVLTVLLAAHAYLFLTVL